MTSDKKIGEELLKRNDNASGESKDRSSRTEITPSLVTARANRRLRLFWSLTITLWILTTCSLVLSLECFYHWFFPLLVDWVHRLNQGMVHPLTLAPVVLLCRGAYVWVALLTLAAIATLLLITASRRATLREIHAHLADISEQLRQLSQASTQKE
jgi:heme exporter protein D